VSSAALTPRVDKPRVDKAPADTARVEHTSDSPVTRGEDFHGRTKVSAKAIARIVAAIAGESFGVPARSVGVQLDDSSGMLAVTATTGISVPSLVSTRVPAAPTTVLERASAAQSAIRTRTGELTGSRIGPVTVRLNAAIIQEEERAR
jgi:hypothetical protein